MGVITVVKLLVIIVIGSIATRCGNLGLIVVIVVGAFVTSSNLRVIVIILTKSNSGGCMCKQWVVFRVIVSKY